MVGSIISSNILHFSSVNLPILGYLLSLGCDKLLKKDNIDRVLNQAVKACNGDYSCIDTLLKGTEVCNRITAIQLKVTVAPVAFDIPHILGCC